MSTGEKYVAAAYLVLFGTLLLYMALIALKVGRIQRELDELTRTARERAGG
ncbi:MAG TPA: hypothetical protein VKB13_00325 [Gaiellaceae bacterium]|nr:hypothetical protein [Gaiellaceae bacterium]